MERAIAAALRPFQDALAARRWRIAVGAAFILAAIASAAYAGGGGALIVVLLGLVLVLACSVALARDDVAFVASTSALAFLARATVTSLLHLSLQQQNAGGAMFEDDFGYVTMAALVARIWQGAEVPFPVDPSIVNTYVRSAGALFWALGPNVAALKLANTLLAVVACLLAYRISVIVTGERPARWVLAALLLWPSLGLWSSLALKESFSLVFSVAIVWCITEYVRRPRVAWLFAAVVASLPLQDVRGYLFQLTILLWPLSLALVRLGTGRLAWRAVALSAVIAVVLVSNIRPGLAVTPQAALSLEQTRAGMAEGARSAIVENTRTVIAGEGQCFTISIPGKTPTPGRTPRTLTVPLGTTLVFAGRATTDIQPPTGSVEVETGDITCVGRVAPAQGAAPAPSPLVLSQTGSTRVGAAPDRNAELVAGEDGGRSAATSLIRELRYLPQGAAYLIAAPFPWDLAAPGRAVVIPELLFLYPTVVLGFIGVVALWRARRWEALYVVLVGAAIATVLSLAEGNLGTLVRHRGMLVPFAVIVAGAGLVPTIRWLRARGLMRLRET